MKLVRCLPAVVAFLIGALPLAGQAPPPAPVIAGMVRDTARRPIGGVEIVLSDTTGRRLAATSSSPAGRFSFNDVPPGAPHRVAFRKIGYHPATLQVRLLAPGDTAKLNVALITAVTVLPEVATRGRADRRPYSIDSLTIAGKPNRDAYDVVVRYPWMVGDGYKGCTQDTSTLTVAPDARLAPRRLKSMSSFGEPFRLFVDGRLRMEQGAKDILSQIPADSIAEVHYVGCWDKERPYLRNSLFVILKHPRVGPEEKPIVFSEQPRPETAPRLAPGAPDTAAALRDSSLAAVAGVAIDGLHGGTALGGARIVVRGTSFETTTDAAGRYRLDGLTPGEYRLTASHPLLDTLGVALVTPPTTVRAGATTKVDFPLQPAAELGRQLCGDAASDGSGAVVGSVLDAATDAPIKGARVTFVWSELQVGKKVGLRRVPVTREAATDESGRYRLCGIPGGVGGEIRAALDSGATTAPLPVGIAGGQLVLGVFHLDVAARNGVGTATAAGRVVDNAGNPLGRAVVRLIGTTAQTTSDGDGAFKLEHVAGGTQLLVVLLDGYSPAQLVVELAGGQDAKIEVALTPEPRS